jgi:hypothetical protein
MQTDWNAKCLVMSPFTPISKNIASHRAAQAVIYADQLRQSGLKVDVMMSGDKRNIHDYQALYVYHGNDWGGSLNLFGGLKEFNNVDNFVEFSKFKGDVYSLAISFPDYHAMLQNRIHRLVDEQKKPEDVDPRWHTVDWDNLKRMQKCHIVEPNYAKFHPRIACGDSHAICMYRPGWMINSVPFKTLYGALKDGLEQYVFGNEFCFAEMEFYFGNIDIRHHLCRQSNPEHATRELVQHYFERVKHFNVASKIYEPLPIEDVSRQIPKTGWYKSTPFYGSWEERNEVRNIFIDECKRQESDKVKLFQWTNHMINTKGQLDFKFMEQPKSVHLSREHYPHWQGKEYNTTQSSSLEDFFS